MFASQKKKQCNMETMIRKYIFAVFIIVHIIYDIIISGLVAVAMQLPILG